VSGAVRFVPVHCDSDAEGLGFTRSSRGDWVRNGCSLRSAGSWLALVLREPGSEVLAHHGLGGPGLWRVLREPGQRSTPRFEVEFDLPPLALLEAPDGAGAEHPCAALVRWAEATQEGSTPVGWEPPPRVDVEEWADPARRTVRTGSHVAQIDLLVEPGRLALAIPALVRIPAELPPARAAWLEEICWDVHERWRMVRFGIDEAAGSVRAEVDLSGAPADRTRPLVELGLEALDCSAAWALPGLSLVTDPVLSSEALEREPRWASPRLSKGGRNR
jgi:hypothetical protein